MNMNKSNTNKQSFILAALLLLSGLLSGCIREDNTDCPRPFRLFVKAVDIDLQDITESGEVKQVFLFVYNEKGELIQSIELDADFIKNRKAVPIELPYPGFEALHFVAWGNVNDDVNFDKSDLDVTLKDIGAGIAGSPSDLFYGTLNVPVEYGGIEAAGDQTVVIHRKTSQVVITANGLKKWNGNKDGEYTYRLTESHNTIDGKGELTGPMVGYNPNAVMDINGNLGAAPFRTFPTTGGKTYTLEILYNGEVIYSATEGTDGVKFVPEVGRLLNIYIDFRAEVGIYVAISPWDVVHQFVVIG